MVRTRKRFYGQEVSQSLTNIAYSNRSRPKQFDQQEKASGPHPIDGVSAEAWGQMTRIFGGCTPSTSTGRSSQSRGSTSSISSGNKSKLHDALAELAHSGDLDFDAIERVKQYVTKCEASLHTFMKGTQEYRASVVREYLERTILKSQTPFGKLN